MFTSKVISCALALISLLAIFKSIFLLFVTIVKPGELLSLTRGVLGWEPSTKSDIVLMCVIVVVENFFVILVSLGVKSYYSIELSIRDCYYWRQQSVILWVTLLELVFHQVHDRSHGTGHHFQCTDPPGLPGLHINSGSGPLDDRGGPNTPRNIFEKILAPFFYVLDLFFGALYGLDNVY